jgi:hypothetical protein
MVEVGTVFIILGAITFVAIGVGFTVMVVRDITKTKTPTTPRWAPTPVNKFSRLASVKNGDKIRVHGSSLGVFNALVINNMPSEEKMLIIYSNGKYAGAEVVRYIGMELREFNVLNVVEVASISQTISAGSSVKTAPTPIQNSTKYFYNSVFDLYEQAVNVRCLWQVA